MTLTELHSMRQMLPRASHEEMDQYMGRMGLLGPDTFNKNRYPKIADRRYSMLRWVKIRIGERTEG